jgi:alpha-1,2-mannosyltransferase
MAEALLPEAATPASYSLRNVFARVRRGDWLDRRRILAYGTILLALEIVTFVVMVLGTHGLIVPLTNPTTTDFVSFYAAGELANAGTPQLAYDQAVHYALEEQITEPGIGYQFFYYPPIYLLLCGLFARLPYLPSFVVFETVSLLLYLHVARRILREPGYAVFMPLLAFPAVFWTLGLGQNSFLTAALFGAATSIIDRRPILAGLLLGALCYKPHFGLLVPVALAAGGYWRSFAAAAVAAVGFAALSLGVFGWDTWQAFLAVATDSHATYENGRIELAGIVSPFAAIRLLGVSTALAYAAQAIASLAAALFVAHLWRQPIGFPVKAAALVAATLVAIPIILIYDLMLAMIAVAWLMRAARDTGFLPWEKAVFALVFAAALISRSIGLTFHLPLALFINVMLLAIIGMRAQHEIDLRQRAI